MPFPPHATPALGLLIGNHKKGRVVVVSQQSGGVIISAVDRGQEDQFGDFFLPNEKSGGCPGVQGIWFLGQAIPAIGDPLDAESFASQWFQTGSDGLSAGARLPGQFSVRDIPVPRRQKRF